ncbi:MAG: glycerophosphodiester phosphodiesterase family protein [Clostridia bacterium]|nr:glycerophosphodiester phosphodiesterase family protein [Clostridia bacterium]
MTNLTRKTPFHKCWLTSAHRGLVDDVLKENTLAAFYNAYLNGADMIETDARMSCDGVLICNHNATAVGTDPATGETVTYTVAETNAETLCSLILSRDEKWGTQTIPTLEQVLHLAYNTGMIVNIDMKAGAKDADAIVDTVLRCGMRGRVIYATNGAGAETILQILRRDADARFIDTPSNYTAEKLAEIEDRNRRCFAYTGDFSKENIDMIRKSGCMLALISLRPENFRDAMVHHPDMCEYLHTSDFRQIETDYFDTLKLF